MKNEYNTFSLILQIIKSAVDFASKLIRVHDTAFYSPYSGAFVYVLAW